MAKKTASKKAPIIKFDVDFECLIKVNPDGKDAFFRDLKRKELSLSVEFVLGDVSHGLQIYADEFKNGVNFHELDTSTFKVSAKDIIQREYDAETYAQLQAEGSVPLLLTSVGDLDVNYHYIDGSEGKTIEIGKYVA